MARNQARTDAREPARVPPRIEREGAAVAVGRDGKPVSRRKEFDAVDQFQLPEYMNEQGWSRQWVRFSVYNQEDHGSMNDHMSNGWTAVTHEQYPGAFGTAGTKGAIIRDGLMLMERPQSLTDEAVAERQEAAHRQRADQVKQFCISELPAGFSMNATAATKNANFARRGEAVQVTDPALYPKRELAIGDDE